MEIKDILKERRIARGLSMKELAEKVGVSEGTISRWESGDIANMRRDKIAALSDVLGISPMTILGIEEGEHYYLNDEVAELAQALYERPEMRVLFDASRKATKEDIEQVADILARLSTR